MGCQPGDWRRQDNNPNGFVWVNIHTFSIVPPTPVPRPPQMVQFNKEQNTIACNLYTINKHTHTLTLKVLNFWKFTSYCSLKPLRSGMGEVVPVRTLPAQHPPSPFTVHQLSRLALQELSIEDKLCICDEYLKTPAYRLRLGQLINWIVNFISY